MDMHTCLENLCQLFSCPIWWGHPMQKNTGTFFREQITTIFHPRLLDRNTVPMYHSKRKSRIIYSLVDSQAISLVDMGYECVNWGGISSCCCNQGKHCTGLIQVWCFMKFLSLLKTVTELCQYQAFRHVLPKSYLTVNLGNKILWRVHRARYRGLFLISSWLRFLQEINQRHWDNNKRS